MFGLTLNKIIFTVLVIIVVWRGFRWLEQARARTNMATQVRQARREERAQARQQAERPRQRATVDLVECPKCGAYVPNGTFCPDESKCELWQKSRGVNHDTHAA